MKRQKHNIIIVVPDEGYSISIYEEAVETYRWLIENCWTPIIIISGATRNPEDMKSYGLKKFLEKFFKIIPIQKQIEIMKKSGVPASDIIHEDGSMNTRENAVNSLRIIKELDIQAEAICIVSSVETMSRKLLTFKRAMQEADVENIKLRSVPVFGLISLRMIAARMLLAPGEFLRIRKYRKLGHI